MKKFILINSSPRPNGNTRMLCDAFKKGVEESGNTATIYDLKDLNIGFCNACGYCKKVELNVCCQHDDMDAIYEDMRDADGIVLAGPVYYYTINARLKNFIDRLYRRTRMLDGKDFYFFMTAGEGRHVMEHMLGALRILVDILPNAKEKGVVYGDHASHKGDISEQALNEAYLMGKNA